MSQHYNALCPMPREKASFSMLEKPSSPPGDKGGRVIPGASSGQLVLVGGRGGDGTLVPQHECLWLFSPHTNTWTCPPFQPSPRAMHRWVRYAAFCPHNEGNGPLVGQLEGE